MVTGGKYRHVEIVFSDGVWYGAVAKGLRFTDDISGNKDKWHFVLLDVSLEQEAAIRFACEMKEGQKYDYSGILSFVSFGLVKQDPRAYYCSEVIRWVLGLSVVGVLPRWKGERCAPSGKGGLFELLKAL